MICHYYEGHKIYEWGESGVDEGCLVSESSFIEHFGIQTGMRPSNGITNNPSPATITNKNIANSERNSNPIESNTDNGNGSGSTAQHQVVPHATSFHINNIVEDDQHITEDTHQSRQKPLVDLPNEFFHEEPDEDACCDHAEEDPSPANEDEVELTGMGRDEIQDEIDLIYGDDFAENDTGFHPSTSTPIAEEAPVPVPLVEEDISGNGCTDAKLNISNATSPVMTTAEHINASFPVVDTTEETNHMKTTDKTLDCSNVDIESTSMSTPASPERTGTDHKDSGKKKKKKKKEKHHEDNADHMEPPHTPSMNEPKDVKVNEVKESDTIAHKPEKSKNSPHLAFPEPVVITPTSSEPIWTAPMPRLSITKSISGDLKDQDFDFFKNLEDLFGEETPNESKSNRHKSLMDASHTPVDTAVLTTLADAPPIGISSRPNSAGPITKVKSAEHANHRAADLTTLSGAPSVSPGHVHINQSDTVQPASVSLFNTIKTQSDDQSVDYVDPIRSESSKYSSESGYGRDTGDYGYSSQDIYRGNRKSQNQSHGNTVAESQSKFSIGESQSKYSEDNCVQQTRHSVDSAYSSYEDPVDEEEEEVVDDEKSSVQEYSDEEEVVEEEEEEENIEYALYDDVEDNNMMEDDEVLEEEENSMDNAYDALFG
eukprot:CAMPEP_0182440558 /NCGR_PEP_ID=MMETSP1167-20130531/87142_1 /TAXON_ID=2988 /ORGANISM="Mallomonas Sp, Strain CCMP3275" /LENGTH=655 /DNA_ID=CAMNT_0024634549 /DNA_START=733 /DNA_END=2700 /DNA_ORIENTATION=-